MIADEKENQLRRCHEENKGQSLIQPDPTFEDGFSEPADGSENADITVLATEPHPEDGKRGAYEQIKLSKPPDQGP